MSTKQGFPSYQPHWEKLDKVMARMKPRECVCDEIGLGACPVHGRENILQDKLIRTRQQLDNTHRLLTIMLDQMEGLVGTVRQALKEITIDNPHPTNEA